MSAVDRVRVLGGFMDMDKKEQTMHDPSQCSMTEAGCVCVCVCVCRQKAPSMLCPNPSKPTNPATIILKGTKKKGSTKCTSNVLRNPCVSLTNYLHIQP